MPNTHDKGRLFGFDGQHVWIEPTLDDQREVRDLIVCIRCDHRLGQWHEHVARWDRHEHVGDRWPRVTHVK